ncbi:type II toxin-antitoxin system VapC family toxin [Methylobacterium sp. A49B]|uniref:Ribonuclease VapC n=1 Tax=Methylobacterium mesophilicum SR1.6/6 TaxID=908290 RepID=A0A6B9FBJ2_9HYPH|nr:type II toxin-antitoxin system VapC family toxin [Methylobacterium mesophilicum]QGY00983.1 type II toxin-antitoxin system VapC family toxin [Methylobacterium mesophilicum SR1.6/6]
MSFLLDTNVVSELRKSGDGRADANVTRWLSAEDAGRFYLSAITVMELELGIRLVERRDAAQGARLRAWLDGQVLPVFAGRILPIDTAVALRCAGLHVPDPRPERDALLAATALVHAMTVVTRNTADFVPTGVRIVNPWTWPTSSPA